MGHKVFCLDNFSTSSRQNLDSIRHHSNFHLLDQDVTEPFHLEADYIFNLACPASPIHYQADPVRTTKTSILGALNVLELARRTSAVVLQSSTSEVYGDPVCHPQPEHYWGNVNPIGPRSPRTIPGSDSPTSPWLKGISTGGPESESGKGF